LRTCRRTSGAYNDDNEKKKKNERRRRPCHLYLRLHRQRTRSRHYRHHPRRRRRRVERNRCLLLTACVASCEGWKSRWVGISVHHMAVPVSRPSSIDTSFLPYSPPLSLHNDVHVFSVLSFIHFLSSSSLIGWRVSRRNRVFMGQVKQHGDGQHEQRLSFS